MNKLNELLIKHNISQNQLCLETEFLPSRISNYANNRRTPSMKHSRKIVKGLNELGINCTLDDVFPPEQSEAA